jgi:hypothetical protein
MRTERIVVAQRNFQTRLLQRRLLDHVVHVTTRDAFKKIKRDGAIKSNKTGRFTPTHWRSPASYFCEDDCVSVFDFRSVTLDLLEEANQLHNVLTILNPQPAHKPVFLLLKQTRLGALRQWKPWMNEGGDIFAPAFGRGIPHFEAGYPKEIPLDAIDRALLVTVSGVAGDPEEETRRALEAWDQEQEAAKKG